MEHEENTPLDYSRHCHGCGGQYPKEYIFTTTPDGSRYCETCYNDPAKSRCHVCRNLRYNNGMLPRPERAKGAQRFVCVNCLTESGGLIENLGAICLDEDGSSQRYFYIVYADDEETARLIFGAKYPVDGERCCHEYDCCGQFYRRSAQFTRDKIYGYFLVEQDSHQNI